MTEEAIDRDAPDQRNQSDGADQEAACPVVGIGASAGGVDALKRLFPHVTADCGMAFVVVLHLDPEHPSALAEIIGRSTPLPVSEIEDGTIVGPNHVYVIPPNASLTMDGRRLVLGPAAKARSHPDAIDEFFVSLARAQGENAACVVLSGTGSDGTVGLRAAKENGGLILAQAGAAYDGMMRSAVATGLVDFVIPVEEMPAKLSDYFKRINNADRPARDPAATEPNHLAHIIRLLHMHTGHDFSGYKDRTVIRRVQRRMHVLQIHSMADFAERLRRDPREAGLLFQDLLVGVTNFFRDPEAFAALEKTVIPELFKGKGAGDTVRVWVPGCSTGEEAYSIAMLLREASSKRPVSPKLQVFATDIDDGSLDTARIGRYPATIAKDVSHPRLERFFHREDGSYRIAADLRELCLFSTHNLLRDPPFSKLDLISCRNLLIYLDAALQNRVVPLFSYALNQNGYLFIGSSENVSGHPELFLAVDKMQRIFRRRAQIERHVPDFPLTPADGPQRQPAYRRRRAAAVEPAFKAIAERQLLDYFAPAHVVVNAEGDVLHASGRTGRYLELPAGAPDTNVFSMARPGLRLELRAALHKAMAGGLGAIRTKVRIETNGGNQEIELCVQQLRLENPPDTLYMVVFQDVSPVDAVSPELKPDDDRADATARQLEAELQATKDRLQTTMEELESSNEELRSGNEELQSTNEELQSTNEELQTSKEELQSINEELQTVNAELNARVEELSRANNDMANLLESTQIATIFLDRTLTVKRFTPAAKEVFWLVESDAGRPIMHVRPRFEYATLQEDAERVLRTLSTLERPVTNSETGMRYVMRILPYRTSDNVINGVVLTFTDVTKISAAELQIAQLTTASRVRYAELETLLDLVPVAVMIWAGESDVLVNTYGARLLGGAEAQRGLQPAAPFSLSEGERELAPENQPLQRARRTGEAVLAWQGRLQAGQRSAHVMISATPLFADDGSVRGAIAAIVDLSVHKQAEEHQQVLLDELQHRVKNILATVGSLVTRMARTHPTVEAFHNAFLSRITAMGRVHDLLVESAWRGAVLQSLLSVSLEPYITDAGSVRMSGPEIMLPSDTSATLGMVFNELATNAAKYGALSVRPGKIDIAWRVSGTDGGERLHLTWTEQDGAPVNAAGTSGFGTTFVVRSVEYELQGTAVLDFAPTGLRCRIEFPLVRRATLPQRKGDANAGSS